MMHSLGSMVATMMSMMMSTAVVGVDVVADVVSYCVTTYRARSYC